VFDRRFEIAGLAFIAKEHSNELRNAEVRSGDILLNITGDGVTFARACIVPDEILPACVNQHVSIIRVDQKACVPGYLLAFLTHPQTKRYIESFNTGGSRRAITKGHIESFEVPLPPLPIQRRIASILSAYDDLIENHQRRIKILEEMARSLYREWFVHFRFPGHDKIKMVPSPLGPIPQGWEVNAIQEFGEVITGKTPSKANPDFYGQDVPFVKTPDMHGNMFILETGDSLSMAGAESQANKTIPAGSICVSCIGTIGVVSLTTEDCQTNQQINSVILTRGEAREFLFLQLQDLKRKLENLGSTGATMGNVNKGKFESIEILAPPDDLLERYHRLVGPTFSEILNLSHRIQNLRRTRDLLLPRLLSGKVDIEAL
jgi:type I restriction enzyme S subunit